MARSTFRKRADGIPEIMRRGRSRGLAIVLGTLLVGMALVTVATAALALYVAVAVPVVAAAGLLFALRHGRHPGSHPSRRTTAGGTQLHVIDGGLRVAPPGTGLRPPAPAAASQPPARDAGA